MDPQVYFIIYLVHVYPAIPDELIVVYMVLLCSILLSQHQQQDTVRKWQAQGYLAGFTHSGDLNLGVWF